MNLIKKLSQGGSKDDPGQVTIMKSSVTGTPEAIAFVSGSLYTYVFTVPKGYYRVTICMIGGGGSGGSVAYNPDGVSGGGYAGTIISQTVNVIPEQLVNITVGVGGLGIYSNDENRVKQGRVGSASVFGSTSASGGLGGSASGNDDVHPLNYPGNGAQRIVCEGTHYDGAAVVLIGVDGWSGDPLDYGAYANGGQAGFANGTSGLIYTGGGGGNAADASRGAGGGGIVGTGSSGDTSGDGGDGVIKISWGL